MKGEQLGLAVALADPQDFEHFHPGPNGDAIHTLRALLEPEAHSTLLLHGPAGTGKSHLVQALMKDAAQASVQTTLIDGTELAAKLAAPMRKLESTPLLCIDGLDNMPLDDATGLALIRLLDARRNRSVGTLVTAHKPAAQLTLPRADLATRLSAFTAFGLKPLSDEQRIELLRLRASTRGLHLGIELAHYLLRHLARDIPSLLSAIDTLDRASLAAQRRLTQPFVQSTLGFGS